MWQTRYSYNPDTFTFERKKISRREALRMFGVCAVVGVVLAIGFVIQSEVRYGGLEALWLRQSNEVLFQQIVARDRDLAHLENQLEKVHSNDNGFYRSLLNMPRTDLAVWNAGKGGSLEQQLPEGIRQLRARMFRLGYKINLQNQSLAEVEKTARYNSEELRHMPAIKPLGTRVLSGFGYRMSPFHGGSEFHSGLDFHAQYGTPIRATGEGKIITAGFTESGYGLQVEIQHGFGYVTKYAHMSQTKVMVGDKVERNQIIGYSGNSGLSTGPHLHYEVIRNGAKVNPYDYFYSE
jgi:murein DD-endopeptidase MepM/ murein hydrolase activator NlpD